jgi:hypothetical protein
MINLLKSMQELKDKTGAEQIVLGNQGEWQGYILIIQKGSFEKHHEMLLDTENTIDSIADSFLQSYSDSQDLGEDDE